MAQDAIRIATYLRQLATPQGVADPHEGKILPHTYTTDFYAWLCALLFVQGTGDTWLDEALSAVGTALTLRERQQATGRIPSLDGEFHWEFKNLALIYTARLLAEHMPSTLQEAVDASLRAWNNLNIDSTNWSAMRALNYLLRYRRFGKAGDRLRSRLELEMVLGAQTPEGFFPDRPDSYSFQYHAYILAVLALYFRERRDSRVKSAFLKGIHFIADFVDPAGDFNYFGRGQRQLFGYTSLIFALAAASQIASDPTQRQSFAELCQRVLRFVHRFRNKSGVFPLVLHASEEKWGWYDYNYLGDYLACSGVFLLLASVSTFPVGQVPPGDSSDIKCYPYLGLARLRLGDLFAVFAARSHSLAEPLGLVHLYPHGPGPMGGPKLAQARGLDYALNYLGPLAGGVPLLRRRSGSIDCANDRIVLTFKGGTLSVRQTFSWSRGELLLTQEIWSGKKRSDLAPVRVPASENLEASVDLRNASPTPSPTGLRQFVESEAVTLDGADMHVASLIWRRPLPMEEIGLTAVSATHPTRLRVRRLRQNLLKALWVFWVSVVKQIIWN